MILAAEDTSVSPLQRAFEEHHAMVFRAAYRVTGNAADAEDVMQTVFLRLAAGATEVREMENYLRRAAVHASLNLLALKSRKNQPLEDIPEPAAVADRSDLRQLLRLALGRIDRRSAEMFTLRFVEGWSNAEIAAHYGLTSLAVAVALHRARTRLKKEVKELGGRL